MNRLICITGMDGSGKSTLIKNLAAEIESAVVSNIWDIMDGGVENVPFGTKKEVDAYLCALTPDSRLLFLAHLLKFSYDKAMRTNAKFILLNGYYYRYFATELALGANENLVNALMNEFPKPDLVIRID